jgi:hypothetical protein
MLQSTQSVQDYVARPLRIARSAGISKMVDRSGIKSVAGLKSFTDIVHVPRTNGVRSDLVQDVATDSRLILLSRPEFAVI